MDVSPSQILKTIPSPLNLLFLAPTDHDELIKICASLKSGSTPGYDDTKPDAVKFVTHLTAYPLVYIFNLSMSTGIFPDQLKLVKVVPLYKFSDSDSWML